VSAENKGLVRRLVVEVWNRGNLGAVDEIFAPDYVSHGHALDDLSVGAPAFKQRVSFVLSRFVDFEITLQDLIAEEDKVVARWSTRATGKPERSDVAPTDNIFEISEIGIFRVDAEKIVESWVSSGQTVDDLIHQNDKAVSSTLHLLSATELIPFPPS